MELSLHFGVDLLIFQVRVLSSVPRVLAQGLSSRPEPLPSPLPAASLQPPPLHPCAFIWPCQPSTVFTSLHSSLGIKSEP